jgi:urease alpha subunit
VLHDRGAISMFSSDGWANQHQARHGAQPLRADDGDRARNHELGADGMLLTCDPAAALPMAQRDFLF